MHNDLLALIQGVVAGRHTLAVLPTPHSKMACALLPAWRLPGCTVVVSQDHLWWARECQRVSDLPVWCEESPAPNAQHGRRPRQPPMSRHRLVCLTPGHLARNAPAVAALRKAPASLLVLDDPQSWLPGSDGDAGLDVARLVRQLGRPTVLALACGIPLIAAGRLEQALGLGPMARVTVGIYRAHLSHQVERLAPQDDPAERALAWVRRTAGGVIVHVPEAAEAVRLHALLQEGGEAVALELPPGGQPARARDEALQAFQQGRRRILVTQAGAAGCERGDIRLVLHQGLPDGLDTYQRETAAAGLDGEAAQAVLLYRPGDERNAQALARRPLPHRRDLAAVLQVLHAPPPGAQRTARRGPWRTEDLQAATGLPGDLLQPALRILARHHVVSIGEHGVELLSDDACSPRVLGLWVREHADHQIQRREAMERLVYFASTRECRWKVILDYLREEVAFTECGVCDNCMGRQQRMLDSRLRGPAPPWEDDETGPVLRPGQVVSVLRHGWGEVQAVHGELVSVDFLDGRTGRFMADYVRPLSPQALRLGRRLMPTRVSALLQRGDHTLETAMTHSNILGLDDVPGAGRPGHGVDALGPSDTTDSGSDLSGLELDGTVDDINQDTDAFATGELMGADKRAHVREAYDILPDRIVDDPDEELAADAAPADDDEDIVDDPTVTHEDGELPRALSDIRAQPSSAP